MGVAVVAFAAIPWTPPMAPSGPLTDNFGTLVALGLVGAANGFKGWDEFESVRRAPGGT